MIIASAAAAATIAALMLAALLIDWRPRQLAAGAAAAARLALWLACDYPAAPAAVAAAMLPRGRAYRGRHRR